MRHYKSTLFLVGFTAFWAGVLTGFVLTIAIVALSEYEGL
jgi:hypothetical protein|tara:strand:+ start:8871 stop:8990 length:120 start_codon:yes stop_codon:yes gene_type:complete